MESSADKLHGERKGHYHKVNAAANVNDKRFRFKSSKVYDGNNLRPHILRLPTVASAVPEQQRVRIFFAHPSLLDSMLDSFILH